VGSKSHNETSLTASPNPSTYGGAVALNATVRTTNGIPTGTVTFLDGGNVLGSAVLGNGSGVSATSILLLTNLAAGTYSLTASYGGDPNFGGSLSSIRSLTVNPIVNSAGLNQLTAGLSGGNLMLTFLGNPGNRYALEQTFSLSPAVWLPVVTNLAPANGSLQFTNSPTGTNSFWRIRQVP